MLIDKKAIFRSFSAADGQVRGQIDIILAFLNCTFQGLSFDMRHGHLKNTSYFGVTTPTYAPRRGGQSAPTSKIVSDYENIG